MRSWVRWLLRRGGLDAELREELESHVAMRAEWNRKAGLGAEESETAARRQFGNLTRVQEETRRVHIAAWVESIAQDLGYALRGLRRMRGFAAAALLTLALGIGCTTAVFSVVDRILFRGLPYAEDERLYSIGMKAPIEPTEFVMGSAYVDFRNNQEVFESVTSWSGIFDCDLTEMNPLRMSCAHVEQTFLPTLGVSPAIGRNFTAGEDRPNAPPVAVVTDALWRGRFGGDPGLLNRVVSIDGRPVRVIGVLPAGFEFPTFAPVDLLLPQQLDETAQRQGSGRLLRLYARLKPGLTEAQARQQLQARVDEALQTVPRQFRGEVSFVMRTLRERRIEAVKQASLILLGAVLALLLLACANVANLLLARTASRDREVAVRSALGAGRWRLIRQHLVESLLLGGLGAACGCVVAWALLRLFIGVSPEAIPRLQEASLDLRVLLFTMGLALLSSLAFGILPALAIPSGEALTTRQGAGARRTCLRPALVSAQIAISLVLLTGAGLLLRSFWKLQRASLGLRTESVVTAEMTLGQQRFAEQHARMAFFEGVEERLAALPGVTALGLSDSLPPSGRTTTMIFSLIDVEGRPPAEGGTGGMVVWRAVTPGYFRALGISILRGRAFTEEDRQPDRHVIIVSESLARRLFPGEEPLGRRVRPGRSGELLTVVGVAGDVKNGGLAPAPDPEYYQVRKRTPDQGIGNRMLPFMQRRANVALRTQLAPGAVADWVRKEVAALDPTIPVTIETLDQRVSRLADRPRFNAMLLALFAVTGLVLAAVGLYGVVTYLVLQRTQEIGVRMALGATAGNIRRLVLSRALRWTVAGTMAGIAGAFSLSRYLQGLLFEIGANDPWTLACVTALLAAIALFAAWWPARRAARLDPAITLRHD